VSGSYDGGYSGGVVSGSCGGGVVSGSCGGGCGTGGVGAGGCGGDVSSCGGGEVGGGGAVNFVEVDFEEVDCVLGGSLGNGGYAGCVGRVLLSVHIGENVGSSSELVRCLSNIRKQQALEPKWLRWFSKIIINKHKIDLSILFLFIIILLNHP